MRLGVSVSAVTSVVSGAATFVTTPPALAGSLSLESCLSLLRAPKNAHTAWTALGAILATVCAVR